MYLCHVGGQKGAKEYQLCVASSALRAYRKATFVDNTRAQSLERCHHLGPYHRTVQKHASVGIAAVDGESC